MLGRQRLAVGVRREQGERVAEERDRDVRRVALLGMRPRSAQTPAGTSSSSALQWTPSKVTSKRLQRVTQWMSSVTSVRGSRLSSSHESRSGLSTSPETKKSHVARSLSGTEPACRTGHFSVRYWPGGSRAGS